jgi:hypothetical protein
LSKRAFYGEIDEELGWYWLSPSPVPGNPPYAELMKLGELPSIETQICRWMEHLATKGAVFTAEGTLKKIEEEIGELKDAPDDPEEVADIIIAAIVFFHQSGHRNLGAELCKKMRKNEARTWAIQPDGSFHHV